MLAVVVQGFQRYNTLPHDGDALATQSLLTRFLQLLQHVNFAQCAQYADRPLLAVFLPRWLRLPIFASHISSDWSGGRV